MKFYQACYGKPGNNWELFNISKDAPPSLVSVFERHGKASTPENVGVENTINPDGTPKCFYEFISDENAVCIMRVRYGERDGFGRPKMFAHGFVFEGEGLLEDPSELLAVDDTNFAFTAEETEKIPTELSKSNSFDFGKCFIELGITREIFERLIACVHTSLASATDFPLYVVCDNNIQTVKNAIYCILSALPYQLRTHLSFSNANSFQYSRFKRVMFVDSAPSRESYFVLSTGETNISLAEISNEPENFAPYYDFKERTVDVFQQYCVELKETASKIGYPYKCYYEELKMAISILRGVNALSGKSDMELARYLIELLAKIPYQNAFLDDYIAKVLVVLNQREMILTSAIMERLEQRCQNSASAELVDIYKKIRIRVLLNSGTEIAVAFLEKQRVASKTLFNEWRELLMDIKGGKDAVILFYKKLFVGSTTVSALEGFFKEARDFGLGNEQEIVDSAKAHLLTIAKTLINPTTLCKVSFSDIGKELSAALHLICVDDVKSAMTELAFGIQNDFWARFRFSDIAFERLCMMNIKSLKNEKEVKYGHAAEIVKLFEELEYYRSTPRFTIAEKAFKEFRRNFGGTAVLKEFAEKLQEYMYKILEEREGESHFVFWLNLAAISSDDRNPLELLIKWNLPVICNEECFAAEFERSESMKKNASAIVALMVGDDENKGIIDSLESKPELAKLLKREAKLLSDHIKQVSSDEKKREKENEKREKENKKREEELEKENEKREKEERKREKELEKKKEKEEKTKKEVLEEDVDEKKKSGGFFGSLFGKKKK